MNINPSSSRSLRQQETVLKIKEHIRDHKGCMLWICAGFGKTRIITDLVSIPIKQRFAEADIAICVGTKYLKLQWEARVKCNENVYTWQSIYDLPPKSIKVKLLVIDEAHTLLSTEEYIKVLEVFDYEWVIFLTATPRESDLEELLSRGFHVSDKITYEEAEKNGWVAPKREYNLIVPLTEKDSFKVKSLERSIRQKLLFLDPTVDDPENYDGWGTNFGVLELALQKDKVGIVMSDGTKKYLKDYKLPEGMENMNVDDSAKMKLFVKENKSKAYRFKSGKNVGKIKFIYEYVNLNKLALMRNVLPETIIQYSKDVRKMYNLKHEIIYNNPNKIPIVKKILEYVGEARGFVFAKRASICDELVQIDPERMAAYHNDLKTFIEEYEKVKVYKTKPNVIEKKTRKVGLTVQLRRIEESFREGDLQVLVSIKKVEAGADFPDVQWAINHSYDSTSSSHTQKTGRVTRKEGDKIALIINLVSTHPQGGSTMESTWIKKAQKDSEVKPKTITSLEQIEWVD